MYLFCLCKWNVRGRGGGCEFQDNCLKYVTHKLLIQKKNESEIKVMQNLYRLEDFFKLNFTYLIPETDHQ